MKKAGSVYIKRIFFMFSTSIINDLPNRLDWCLIDDLLAITFNQLDHLAPVVGSFTFTDETMLDILVI